MGLSATLFMSLDRGGDKMEVYVSGLKVGRGAGTVCMCVCVCAVEKEGSL